MRRILYPIAAFVLVAAVSAAVTSCASKSEASVAKIKLPTIQCGSCVKTVTTALEKAEGVEKVEVSLDGKVATVTYASEKTDVKKLEQAVAKSGYAANNTKADPAAYEKLASCCKVGGGSH
jgi:copper chaperone CopZ